MTANGSAQWVEVCREDDVQPDLPHGVEVAERYIALFRIGERIFATAGYCSHAMADLCNGYIDGETVECPIHQARFHIPTGRVLCEPAEEDIATYRVRTEGGRVYVLLDGG